MKKTNKKLITLLLSGMLGVAALGAGLVKTDAVYADESTAPAVKTYTLTDVFSSNHTSVVGAEKKADADTAETATFTLSKGENVEFRRNLALKWFDEVGGAVSAQYFSVKLSLKNTNFDALSVVVESESANANADGKATNKVTFTKTASGTLAVSVNGVASGTEIAATDEIAITLSEDANAEYGTFNLLLNGVKVGEFTNIGANYAAYTSNKVIPFSIVSEKEEGEEVDATAEDAVVFLHELNNQKFDNIVIEKDVKKVPDTAAPVIVINDDITDGLLIGTAFSYYAPTVLDVMPNSDSKIATRSFYQWNPADATVTYNKDMKSTHYFMDTTYYVAADGSVFATREDAAAAGKEVTATTVYKENDNQEFLSVKYAVQDDSMELSKTTKEYHLAWYADDNAKETKNGVEYVYLNKKNEGATYNYITAGWTDDKGDTDTSNDEFIKENVISQADINGKVEGDADFDADTTFAKQVEKYQTALEKVAQEASVGSNSYVYFPSLAWLIQDNNGYRNLKFVICYKSPSSTAGKSTSALSYNGLRLSTTDEGYYEFKVYATDAAGNPMKYYLDGELVNVSATTIWDIEEIPSFHYTIERKGVSIKNDSDVASKRKDDVEFNGKFSGFSDPTIVGMSSKKSAYALYKVDTSVYNEDLAASKKALTDDVMAGITYASLKTEIDKQFKDGNIPAKGEYFEFYLDIYARKLATALGATSEPEIEKIKSCFVRIDDYDSSITEDDAAWDTNKFQWNSSNKSFVAVEECEYLIFADYYESDLATQRILAYKVIEVEAEEDVNYIKTKWIQNNITSVILFAIAGVMFVIIIILLLVKPSDETLEDVEEAANEQNNKKKGN